MKWMKLILTGLIMMTQHALTQEKTGAPTFGDDLAFLKKYTEVIVLSDKTGAQQVAVIPAYQARIMTSTADGMNGISFGWVNRELIASGKIQPHINVYGGEDRFWIGPEGGQFSVFFAKGAKFDLEHWFTPPAIDTEPFELVSKSREHVLCRRQIQLTNYSGTIFNLAVNREIRLLDAKTSWGHLGLSPKPQVKMVAVESINMIKNIGANSWNKKSGLLSIWILGMFNASPVTTVVIPFKTGPETDLGPIVNDAYFGKVPAERLVIKEGVMFFAADANYRSKIGVSPRRSKPVMGSYDAVNQVLTLAQFTLPEGATDYVNSMWQLQDDPFAGDAVNSYNDGPPAPGAKQLGKFYELESSSPALALAPNESATHVHRTIHLQGAEKDLDAIARTILGVGVHEIQQALKK
ncbi:MAG: hypothetical protein ONB44_12945 [candidate division KSB1 bacterium]|nr:hypothetical protein [candidate division KSB1 bacterium]MDZ7303027.1 hypothetical protein [candidate division KSB1 bacterium]MDZ7312465.1 hypothetical protein [candidate division KSB1 bacterium]